MVMYGPTLLDDRPEVGERFAVAMLQALRQYAEGKTARNLEIIAAASGLTEEQLEAACWPDLRTGGRIDPAVFDGYQQWNLERGFIDRTMTPDELFAPHFMEHAHRELDR